MASTVTDSSNLKNQIENLTIEAEDGSNAKFVILTVNGVKEIFSLEENDEGGYTLDNSNTRERIKIDKDGNIILHTTNYGKTNETSVTYNSEGNATSISYATDSGEKVTKDLISVEATTAEDNKIYQNQQNIANFKSTVTQNEKTEKTKQEEQLLKQQTANTNSIMSSDEGTTLKNFDSLTEGNSGFTYKGGNTDAGKKYVFPNELLISSQNSGFTVFFINAIEDTVNSGWNNNAKVLSGTSSDSKRATQNNSVLAQSAIDTTSFNNIINSGLSLIADYTMTSNLRGSLSTNKFVRQQQCIILPTPSLSYSNSINYDVEGVLNSWGNTINSTVDLAKNSLNGIASWHDLVNVLASAGKDYFQGDRKKQIQTGSILKVIGNPRKDIMFDDVNLTNFEFAYTFFPQSKSESDNIEAIIRQFRFHSAPRALGEHNQLFVYPAEFDICHYIKTDTSGNVKINPHVPKIPTCVLTKVGVQYGGENVEMPTHDGGYPLVIKLSLSFQATVIITKQEIQEGY